MFFLILVVFWGDVSFDIAMPNVTLKKKEIDLEELSTRALV